MLTAVFDIGKTNKKFLLFDEHLSVVSVTSTQFDEIADDDGEPCEDIDAITSWMKETLIDAKNNAGEGAISKINFSTYGASLVHVGEDGERIGPLYNYLRDYPADVLRSFNATYGKAGQFATATGSPIWGMLNSGLQLYWIKKTKPKLFEKIRSSLHLPQYCSYVFSGEAHDEATSLGCHTGMWDFSEGDYHAWLEAEGVRRLIPPLRSSDSTFPDTAFTAGAAAMRVGSGVHDSSAALFPYLCAFEKPFLFVSTGTWIVTMNPFASVALTTAELREGALYYMTPNLTPVKASRMFLGFEHEHHVKRIAAVYDVAPESLYDMAFSQKMLDRSRIEKCTFEPSSYVASGSVGADRWNPGSYGSAAVAYHALMDGIVRLEMEAIAVARGDTTIETVFVDGGFAKNPIFLTLLSRALAPVTVRTTELAQATAVGAALLVNEQFGSGRLRSIINTQSVST